MKNDKIDLKIKFFFLISLIKQKCINTHPVTRCETFSVFLFYREKKTVKLTDPYQIRLMMKTNNKAGR